MGVCICGGVSIMPNNCPITTLYLTKAQKCVCFDICKAIDQGQGQDGNYGICCSSLSWERSYIMESKYEYEVRGGQAAPGAFGVSSGRYVYWYTFNMKMERGPNIYPNSSPSAEP